MEVIKQLQSRLTILFFALLFGQVSFGAVVIFFLKPEPRNAPEESIFMAIASALLFAGIVAGMLIAKARLKAIKDLEPTRQVNAYTGMSIIRYALMEGPVLASIVFFLLTGNQIFQVFIGVGLAYFLTLFPSSSRISRELEISDTI